MLHRHIKPENVLYIRNSKHKVTLKLSYVGCGQILSSYHGSVAFGTLRYMAPEVLNLHMDGKQTEQTDGYDAKADLWSLGLVIWQLSIGGLPNTSKQLPPDVPTNAGPPQVVKLLREILVPHERRMTVENFFKNDYVRSGNGVPIQVLSSSNIILMNIYRTRWNCRLIKK